MAYIDVFTPIPPIHTEGSELMEHLPRLPSLLVEPFPFPASVYRTLWYSDRSFFRLPALRPRS